MARGITIDVKNWALLFNVKTRESDGSKYVMISFLCLHALFWTESEAN